MQTYFSDADVVQAEDGLFYANTTDGWRRVRRRKDGMWEEFFAGPGMMRVGDGTSGPSSYYGPMDSSGPVPSAGPDTVGGIGMGWEMGSTLGDPRLMSTEAPVTAVFSFGSSMPRGASAWNDPRNVNRRLRNGTFDMQT